MRSPFPGMDPYLELRWEDIHSSLTVYARDAIQPQLPDDLWALAQDRAYRQPLDPPLPEADATWAEVPSDHGDGAGVTTR